MSVLNILFVGSDEVARSIAKKSDSRDVDNYIYKDLKEGGLFSTISILRPNNYPDKPKPFFTSLTVSDFGIIEINKSTVFLVKLLFQWLLLELKKVLSF